MARRKTIRVSLTQAQYVARKTANLAKYDETMRDRWLHAPPHMRRGRLDSGDARFVYGGGHTIALEKTDKPAREYEPTVTEVLTALDAACKGLTHKPATPTPQHCGEPMNFTADDDAFCDGVDEYQCGACSHVQHCSRN